MYVYAVAYYIRDVIHGNIFFNFKKTMYVIKFN